MGFDHPSFVPTGPFGRRVFFSNISNIFQHGGRPPSRILKILIFGHITVIWVLICCCLPNFIKIGSRDRPPDAHNCWIFNMPLLGNGRYQATAVTMATAAWRACRGDDGMRPPKFRPNRSIDRQVKAFPIFSNMAAVRHLQL